jgi:hypothetical protein
VAYVFFGVAMVLSLVFIPFVPQALKLAMCVSSTKYCTTYVVERRVAWPGLA